MLPRSEPGKRIHPDCPDELREYVRVALATGIAGKAFFKGETLGDLVKRELPALSGLVCDQGFELRFDMPENTHKALTKGRVNFQIRKPPAH